MESESAAGPPGVSGRRVTFVVLAGLIVVGGWLSYTLWTYNQIDNARAATADIWRSMADQLSSRYRTIERLVATEVDAQRLPMESGERFRLAVDRFRTTAQPAGQHAAAREVEELLSKQTQLDLPPPAPELYTSTESLNACLRDEQQVLSSPGGRFLSLFLQFSKPVEIHLAE